MDNFYFDLVSKALDDEGIYISLAYCNPEMRVSPDAVDEIVSYDEYELEADELYFKKQYVKVELGLCKGKKLYDKRETIAKRDAKRDIDRAMKNAKKYHD